MRTWEPVEISINKLDVSDIMTQSYGTSDTPLVGGGTGGTDSEDIMGGLGN